MRRTLPALLATVLLVLAAVVPAGAQDDAISVTPATGLLDGQTVEISATTAASDYATLGLCPAASAPGVGDPVTDLLSTRTICVGLVCLHDGDTEPALIEAVSADCSLAVQDPPISSVSTSVALPRFTNDGTDCAVADCVVVFNTWNSGSAQGAVSTAVRFDETEPAATSSTTTLVLPAEPTTTIAAPVGSTTTTTTTTTVALSSPTVTSSAPPVVTTTTVATVVLGAQETNDGELAVTGIDAGAVVALGLALLFVGGGTLGAARRD